LPRLIKRERRKALEKFLLGLIADNSPDKTQDYSTGTRRYKEVIKVLKEHIGEDLTVEEVSRLSHLSISYIKKLFSFYAGCGVMQYFIKLKVLKAIKYLQEGYSVGEISDMLGFSIPSYFSVVFKKETGKAPAKYKEK
jgi:AraC-like DNA-binding protein